jgi:hypothetical protein
MRSSESFVTPIDAAMRSAVRNPTPQTSIASRYGFPEMIATAFGPYRLKMRVASMGLAPCDWRKIITSRTARCSCHAATSASARVCPRPLTSRRRWGSASSTLSVSSPNFSTMRCAVTSPTPLMRPEPRYFSIPTSVSGTSSVTLVARSCSPWLRSTSRTPRARTREPTATCGNVPTIVSWPRRPGTATLTTRKPFSRFSNVMRSTSPSIAISCGSATRQTLLGPLPARDAPGHKKRTARRPRLRGRRAVSRNTARQLSVSTFTLMLRSPVVISEDVGFL